MRVYCRARRRGGRVITQTCALVVVIRCTATGAEQVEKCGCTIPEGNNVIRNGINVFLLVLR